jgi:hypothetical protein
MTQDDFNLFRLAAFGISASQSGWVSSGSSVEKLATATLLPDPISQDFFTDDRRNAL